MKKLSLKNAKTLSRSEMKAINGGYGGCSDAAGFICWLFGGHCQPVC